ncbi:MAG: tetratricopeptide repeat protein [Methylococcales bacterium]
MALAEKAVELEPGSPILRVALSYARQASFDIEGARESIRKALELSPDDPLAWARLSELELSSGELDEALEAAEKAEALDPDISHTQMVLGFARLLQIDIDEARQSFQKAIELDPSAPLPRLGMGLAKIRQGDVEQGTQDIEVAALLDPENALVRSYLGKAYYEEKRGSVASREFEIAKKLDPKDPTPWFYDAIHKQTTNRPVEALHDMQKAIELNDNRAVYRSSLLLDDDLAARSASLGRIYNDLGFQNRGLLEGWKSVNGDPSNYSAHRLLADNYAALPRHEIARVSELLQSQLLQPINLTPIQPHLGDKNLLTLSALGTQRLSFNEFNPLFARNRAVLQASGVLGTNDTYGDEIVQSGLWNRFSYSLGQLHSRTKGFRENNDVGNNVYNAFAQITVSPELSLQTEYRYSNTRHGDLQLKWNLDNFRQFDRRRLVTQSVRLGAHYTPGTNSDLIVSAVYLKAKENQTIEVSTPFSSFLVNPYFQSRGYIGETQYLLKIPNYNINLVAGGGLFNFNQNQSGLQGESNFRTAYIYSYIRYPSTATWTFGLGFDSLDDYIFGRFNILNPKLGLIWNITPDTTFRIAGFRGLARAFIGNQTIEPTQVSGFNQLFDDAVGAQSTRYGLAIDQRIFPSIYCGIEVSRRDLKVPKLAFPVENGDWKEELLRGYINWTPSSEIVLTVQYQFEKFRRSAVFDFLPVTDTHFVPVTLGYFHPEGYIARLTTTYVNQSVQFPNGVQDHSQFGLFDIGIGYRLPQRFGIINLGINNVFNKKFNFQGLSGRNFQQEAAQFVPERTISAQFTLSF